MVEEDHPCSRHHHYYKHSFHCSYFSYEGTHTNTTHMTRTTMIYYQGKKIWWTVFGGIFWISKLDPPWRNFGSLEHQQLYLSRDWSSRIQGNLRGAFCLQLPLSPCRFHKGVSRTGEPSQTFWKDVDLACHQHWPRPPSLSHRALTIDRNEVHSQLQASYGGGIIIRFVIVGVVLLIVIPLAVLLVGLQG